MRCPKCHYISFDSGERCRNCGYDFSLSAGEPSLDLPIQDRNEPLGPLGELTLADLRITAPPARDIVRAAAAPEQASSTTTPELPLFGDRRLDDGPPLVIPSVPRQPLSVRRANPSGARSRARGPADDEPALDLGPPQADGRNDRSDVGADAASDKTAGLVRRLLAACIDLLILVPLDAAIIYFSLRLCGLTTADIRLLPPLPLGAFLLLLNGGYLVMFIAAGGQTIGKMATGVRVVPL
ncbi:MAG: RDD family protein, partial [Acidobacteria bacterium]|nr:RDD family protein [Acidobacteriota bacterium]